MGKHLTWGNEKRDNMGKRDREEPFDSKKLTLLIINKFAIHHVNFILGF